MGNKDNPQSTFSAFMAAIQRGCNGPICLYRSGYKGAAKIFALLDRELCSCAGNLLRVPRAEDFLPLAIQLK
jgi:hypothetical protein